MLNLQELLKSKKFKVMLVSVVGIILMALATEGTLTPEAIEQVQNIVLAYLGAQGLADLGTYWNGSNG